MCVCIGVMATLKQYLFGFLFRNGLALGLRSNDLLGVSSFRKTGKCEPNPVSAVFVRVLL